MLFSLLGLGASFAFLGDDAGTDDTPDNGTDDNGSGGSPPDDPTPDDALSGTAAADDLSASGTQTLRGLDGNDTLEGNGGTRLYGDVGADRLLLSGNSSGYGGFGDDTLLGIDQTSLYGGLGDDNLLGGTSPLLDGGAGNDLLVWTPVKSDPTGHDARLSGGDGDDTLTAFGQDSGSILAEGGKGKDLIIVENTATARGGVGADMLVGAGGTTLFGGADADTFVAAHQTLGLYPQNGEPVVIGDFAKGTDRIVVELATPPQAITLAEQNGDTVLTIEWSGTADPDAKVVVKGVTGLALTDFEFVTGSEFTAEDNLGFVLGKPTVPLR